MAERGGEERNPPQKDKVVKEEQPWPKFDHGDRVKVLLNDVRFEGRTGKVVAYTTEEYWMNKGTPVVVQFDNGPRPKGWVQQQSIFKKWPRYSVFFFGEEEIEKVGHGNGKTEGSFGGTPPRG